MPNRTQPLARHGFSPIGHRAISFLEPWASLCADGLKTFENRVRAIAKPGIYYIHASSRWSHDECHRAFHTSLDIGGTEMAKKMLHRDQCCLGGIIGWIQLGEFSRVKTDDPWSRWSGFPILAAGRFKDFYPCKGRLGTFVPVTEMPLPSIQHPASSI